MERLLKLILLILCKTKLILLLQHQAIFNRIKIKANFKTKIKFLLSKINKMNFNNIRMILKKKD